MSLETTGLTEFLEEERLSKSMDRYSNGKPDNEYNMILKKMSPGIESDDKYDNLSPRTRARMRSYTISHVDSGDEFDLSKK